MIDWGNFFMLALNFNEERFELPLFINHRSARYYFKQKFGIRFVMVDSYVENNVKFYIYHLVLNKKIYIQSANAIREGSPFLHSEFENSYKVIEISEDGYVFIK